MAGGGETWEGKRRTGLEAELPGLLCVGLQARTAPPPKATVLSDSHSLPGLASLDLGMLLLLQASSLRPPGLA